MKNQKRLILFNKKNKKKYKLLDEAQPFYTKVIYKNKKLLKSKKLVKPNKSNLILFLIMKVFLIVILLILYIFIKNYYACFSGMGKKENRYLRELIEYYLKLGVEKFILGDNNLPNTEKFADVIQDYINNGIVDIVELFGSTFGQGALNNVTYEKYNKQCKWMLFLDFDEFLEVHFEDKKSLLLKDFLENKIFDKCEAILFNVLVHTDNNLVPVKGVEICDSKGRKIERYDPYYLDPPVFDYGYLKHYTTKTAEEYITKILRGTPGGHPNNVDYRVELFFKFNKYSEEKMKIFENYFRRKFHVRINN